MNKTFTADLKAEARASLLGKWGFLAAVFLTEILLNMILQELISSAFPSPGLGIAADGSVVFSIPRLLCQLIIELISLILSAGSVFLYLNICRGKNFQFNDLFYGFTHQPEHIIGYFAVMTAAAVLFGAVPMLLLFLASSSGNAVWAIGLLVSVPVCLVGYLRVTLSYAVYPYLYADSPWRTSRELLNESRRMMEGNRMRYFYLQLSFFGLLLLGLLSFGIGMIWINSYISMTSALFYLKLASEHAGKENVSDSVTDSGFGSESEASSYESDDEQDLFN